MPTKSKVPKPIDPQQLILAAIDRLTSQVEALVRTSATQRDAATKKYALFSNDTLFTAATPYRPTLKWAPLLTSEIDWCVRCDPIAFANLKPGANVHVRCHYDQVTLSFNGHDFGSLEKQYHNIVTEHTLRRAKFHAYLTTSRQVAVKVGYPAQ